MTAVALAGHVNEIAAQSHKFLVLSFQIERNRGDCKTDPNPRVVVVALVVLGFRLVGRKQGHGNRQRSAGGKHAGNLKPFFRGHKSSRRRNGEGWMRTVPTRAEVTRNADA